MQAGKYERDHESGKAKSLYEFLVNNFPNSQYSEKANDRLLQMKDVEE